MYVWYTSIINDNIVYIFVQKIFLLNYICNSICTMALASLTHTSRIYWTIYYMKYILRHFSNLYSSSPSRYIITFISHFSHYVMLFIIIILWNSQQYLIFLYIFIIYNSYTRIRCENENVWDVERKRLCRLRLS